MVQDGASILLTQQQEGFGEERSGFSSTQLLIRLPVKPGKPQQLYNLLIPWFRLGTITAVINSSLFSSFQLPLLNG